MEIYKILLELYLSISMTLAIIVLYNVNKKMNITYESEKNLNKAYREKVINLLYEILNKK